MIPPMPTVCACALPAHVPPVCAPCRAGLHSDCAEPPTRPRPELPATFLLSHDGYPTLKIDLDRGRLPIPPVVYETGITHRQPPCACPCSTTPIPDSRPAVPAGPTDDHGTPSLFGDLA